jgi:hypothetical protein
MSRRVFSACFRAASMLSTTAFPPSLSSQYKGLPYHDNRYSGGPQKYQGRYCALTMIWAAKALPIMTPTQKNHGSGGLNPADGTYLNEFRMHDGVDTSYTKFDRKPDLIDDSPLDKVVPPADVPYVGWTEPGEWFNITVDVSRSGINAADFLLHIESRRDNCSGCEWKRRNRTAADHDHKRSGGPTGLASMAPLESGSTTFQSSSQQSLAFRAPYRRWLAQTRYRPAIRALTILVQSYGPHRHPNT